MLRHLLLLALCVSPAIAIDCDKCAGKEECFAACYFRQKVRTTEARAKCEDEGGNDKNWQAEYDALNVKHAELNGEFKKLQATLTAAETRANGAQVALDATQSFLCDCECPIDSNFDMGFICSGRLYR